jgi:hypothetical protein
MVGDQLHTQKNLLGCSKMMNLEVFAPSETDGNKKNLMMDEGGLVEGSRSFEFVLDARF